MVKKILLIIGELLIVLISSFFLYYYYNLNYRGEGVEVEFTIKEGETTRIIATNLKKNNIISSALIFEIYVKTKGMLIQSGSYKISDQKNITEIAQILSDGKTTNDYVTIPEGWRVTQIDELLVENGIVKKGEFSKVAASLEGYLFPDSYKFEKESNPDEVKKRMTDNFWEKTKNLKITPGVVIIASIVEREAKFDEDRRKIAGVYLNRIELGMKLQADPTIQYAKGSWDPITVANYRNIISPYNTYLNEGLPPGPICNPGLKSISAVLNPEKNGYLFFFHKDDGHAVFSETLEEHESRLKGE